MGDFSSSPEYPFVKHLCTKFHLADVISEKLSPEEAHKSKYKWVSKRIDHILGRETLLEYISDVHIGQFGDLNFYHRPIYFKLKANLNTNEKLLSRILSNGNTKKAKTFEAWYGKDVKEEKYFRRSQNGNNTKRTKKTSQNAMKRNSNAVSLRLLK